MDILLVRHGESEGNAAGRIQGQTDAPLTPRGREQAALLGDWLKARDLRWQAAYASPLARARDTAAILAERTAFPAAELDPDLREVGVGALEGLTRADLEERHATFLSRAITDLGDFTEYGGETYDGVQERVRRFVAKITERHRASGDRILVVAHGGVNFHLTKASVCLPVPRVCILTWGNCTNTLLRFRERRGTYMGEVAWHVPIEVIGGDASPGTTRAFR